MTIFFVLYNNKNSNLSLNHIFTFFSTIYEQLWLRHQNELSWRWGTTNIIQLEEQRPEFIGKYKFDIITGKIKKIRKTTEWVLFKKIVSFSVLGIFIIAVILSNIFLFLYKANLIFDSWGTTTLGIANAVQIQIFNFFYTFTAKKLNDWENYEYSNDYFDWPHKAFWHLLLFLEWSLLKINLK